MAELKEILVYINSLNGSSNPENCGCEGKCLSTCKPDNHKSQENCSDEEKEFEGCGDDCLGEDCECCHDPEDDDEDEDLSKSDETIEKKKCCKCGDEQHIRNFISLINGTETKTCLTCRDFKNSKTTTLQQSYLDLKKNMGPCIKCGDTDITHLEFNHMDQSKKKGEVIKMTTVKTQLEERKECDSQCKKCHIIYTYTVQRPPNRPWTNPKMQKRWLLAKEFVNNYKISLCGCQNPKCKDKFDKNVLAFYEFHHKDFRFKRFSISYMIAGGWSIKAIMKELEKCILLCSYCHRIETMADWDKRREYYTSLDRPLIKKKKQENKLNPDAAKEIRRIYNEEDVTQLKLAKQFNVCETSIGNVVNNRIYVDETYEKTKDTGPKITEKDAKEIRRLYNNGTSTVPALARTYNIGERFTYHILSNESYHDPEYIRTKLPKSYTNIQVAEIRNLYNNKKWSFSKLSTKYKMSIGYVSDIITNKSRYDENYVRTCFSKNENVTNFLEDETEEEDENVKDENVKDETVEKLFETEVLEIRELYNNNNVFLSALAREYNVSILYIYEVVNNERYIDENYTKAIRPVNLIKGDVLDIRNLYNQGNLSLSELSENYNISVKYIESLIANKVQVDTTYTRTRLDNTVKLSEEDSAQIRYLHNKNIKVQQLGEMFDISINYVRELISNTESVEASNEGQADEGNNGVTKMEVREMRNLYNNENYSFSDLAEIYCISVIHTKEIISNTKYIDKKYNRIKFPTKFTSEDVCEMRDLYNRENFSFAELRKIYDIDVTFVGDVIANKIRIDTNYVRTNFYIKMTDDDAFEIRRLFNDKNVPTDRLAETYNITSRYVKGIVNNTYQPDRNYIVPNRISKKVDPALKKRIVVWTI